MTRISYAAAAVAVGMSFAASSAMATKSCDIVGTYTDTLGSTIIFTTETSGTAQNSLICASTYSLTVTKNTSKAINVKGKAKGCGNLTAKFVPNYPTCTSATGTVMIKGLGSFNDTITKQSNLVPLQQPRASSPMEDGLR